jgi:predicted DNA-binding transcriptional regulator AlpA
MKSDRVTRRNSALPPNLPPLALRREAAAAFIGVSPSKFDELVRDGRMPQSKRIDGCVLWTVKRLEAAYDALPETESATSWYES